MKGILLDTKGNYKEITLKKKGDYKTIQEAVDGNFETLYCVSYLDDLKKSNKLVCYVNDEGMLRKLDTNPWVEFLSFFGVQVSRFIIVYGNIFILSENVSTHKECDIDPYFIRRVKEYYTCEDEDEFFLELENLQKKKKKDINKPLSPPPMPKASEKSQFITIEEFNELKKEVEALKRFYSIFDKVEEQEDNNEITKLTRKKRKIDHNVTK